MGNSLFCSFNSQIYDVLVVFEVLEKVPYFAIFFFKYSGKFRRTSRKYGDDQDRQQAAEIRG